ncbi:AAA family ATPase [Candidatus Uhrbacteria bacterium]|nr:AAA family ATPase [Candidatus Uhrbacteria bacterium]
MKATAGSCRAGIERVASARSNPGPRVGASGDSRIPLQSPMPLIYSLVGTSASGKTTLFDSIRAEAVPDCSFVAESARTYYQTYDIPLEQRSSFENQSTLQRHFIADLADAVSSGARTVISDSSLISCIVYAMLGQDTEAVRRLTDGSIEHLRDVTLFLLLNPDDIDYQFDDTDAVRTESAAMRIQVHAHLLTVLTALNLPFREISGTIDERIAAVKKILTQ